MRRGIARGARRSIALAASVLAFACSSSDGAKPPDGPSAPATPTAKLMIVTYTEGFRHGSIAIAETTLRNLGVSSGLYQTEFCRTAGDVQTMLTPSHLAGVDAVFFANTTGDLGIPDLRAFIDWVSAGHAFLGAHSASDTYHDAPDYLEMLGGEFLTHGDIAEADVKVDEPSHPIVAQLAPRFRITDELYRFTRFNRTAVTVLLSLDRIPADGLGRAGDPADLPLAWIKSAGSGRVFYTALGHRDEVWQDARFQQHLGEAIRWALRR
jgi:type 1 glutamine amidotransferase